MSLESDLFEKMRPDTGRLADYGFKKNDNQYILDRMICGETMKARIIIDESLHISGRVYDDFDEEYVAFRPEGARGEFAARVRMEYIDLLEDIARHCFVKVPFISDQANRINDYIFNVYHNVPEYIFAKFPGYAVYRNDGGKWYGLIAEVPAGTLPEVDEKKEIINIRVDSSEMAEILNLPGIFPAFHMNKKNWVTAVLDDTLSDAEIKRLVDQSRELISGGKTNLIRSEWIIPSNPKYFDLDHAFSVSELLYWKQSSKVRVGDLVYIYSGMPFGEIRWLCEAVETDLPYKGANDGPVHFEKLMRLKKIRFFDGHLLNRKMIARYGVTNIRGPRYMPKELKEEIIRLYNLEENENE